MYNKYIPTTEKTEHFRNNLWNYVVLTCFYYVLIKNVWRNVTDHIQHNLVIINRKAITSYIVSCVNLQRRKMTGVKYGMSNMRSENDINQCLNYVLCRFFYNMLPCYLIEIDNVYSEITTNILRTS